MHSAQAVKYQERRMKTINDALNLRYPNSDQQFNVFNNKDDEISHEIGQYGMV